MEHEFPCSPAQTLWQWAEDRLQAAGDWGRVETTIKNASIQRDPFSTESEILGLLKREQSECYTAVIAVTFVVENSERMGTANIRVTRSRTFPKGMNFNQGVTAWHNFLQTLVRNFNTKAKRAISRDLGSFLAADNA